MKFILLGLILLSFSEFASAARFEDELEQRKKASDQQILQIGKQISSRTLVGCSKFRPRSECFLKAIRQRTLTTPYEYLSFLQQITGLIQLDIADGKTEKVESLLTLSECLLTLVEHVNLKKSWLAQHNTSPSDEQYVRLVASGYRDLMEKAKVQATETVTDNLVQWGTHYDDKIPHAEHQKQLKQMSEIMKRKVALEKFHFN